MVLVLEVVDAGVVRKFVLVVSWDGMLCGVWTAGKKSLEATWV